MKKRLPYWICFAVLLTFEILIGTFIRDDFIRPYVGDLLVTVLLCCLVRGIWPNDLRWLPLAVFGFAAAVECVQLLDIPALDGTWLGIVVGATFDPVDLLCYGLGCMLFAAADGACRSRRA